MERKLASIRKIDEIRPIAGADLIEIAVVGGWHVIVKKGEYKANDLAVYFEIDSWIPTELAPFLSNGKEPRVYNGVKGERLRTVKMRGQVSQGLLLSIESVFPNSDRNFWWSQLDVDVSQKLGIQKWEKPIPANMSGKIKGNFPTHLCPKTDAERIQNLNKEFQRWKNLDLKFEVSEKLDGTSFTCIHYNRDDIIETHVCSRNLSLEETDDNLYWKIEKQYNIIEKLKKHNLNIAIQGEIIGQGIQNSQFKIPPQLMVFNIYDINTQKYLSSDSRKRICDMLEIPQVPVIDRCMDLSKFDTIFDMLSFAEGKSMVNNTEREGLVWKCVTEPAIMFKTISNRWLLKMGE